MVLPRWQSVHGAIRLPEPADVPNYMPRNERSARLLTRLGFEREGYARAYLKDRRVVGAPRAHGEDWLKSRLEVDTKMGAIGRHFQ